MNILRTKALKTFIFVLIVCFLDFRIYMSLQYTQIGSVFLHFRSFSVSSRLPTNLHIFHFSLASVLCFVFIYL